MMNQEEIAQCLTKVVLTEPLSQRTTVLRQKLRLTSRIIDKDPCPGQGPRLLVAYKGQIRCELLTRSEETFIGRDTDCDICLDSERLSRCHFAVRFSRNGNYLLEDLRSKNGTQVNDKDIESRTLVAGDIIQAGGLVFLYLDDVEESEGLRVKR